jgi:hypothetical protein
MWKLARVLVVSALAVGVVLVGNGTLAQSQLPRLTASSLVYQGSFKVPANVGYEYGGTAMAFDAAQQTLYMVGHDWDQRIGAIRVPAIGGTAGVAQNLVDAGGGSVGTGTWKVGGTLVYKSRLLFTKFIFYDADNTQRLTHFSRPLTLSSGSVTGPSRVGSDKPGYYSGYMGTVPDEWQAILGGPALTGNCCLSIISRTSYGPAAASFDPDALGNATTLVAYPQDHQTLGTYGASGSHPVFNGSTRVAGVVFPAGTRSVLFIGSTGVGNYCYGEASACNDPSNNSKGEHAYPYRGYVWAYDANDLAAVKTGSKQPWQVVPYATWELTALGNVPYWGIGGAAWDPTTKRIYLSEKNADGERPIVHVYVVQGGITSSLPQPPYNVRVIR